MKMKRKVKSWNDLKKVARVTSLGDLDFTGGSVEFAKEMKTYCGQIIELSDRGFCDYWKFDEWMLEPIEQSTQPMTDEQRIEADSQAIFAELLKGKRVIDGQTYYHYESVGAAIGKTMEIEAERSKRIFSEISEAI